MKTLICIGHVPDTTSKIRFTNNDIEFDKSDIQYIVGPYEELALTRLLELKNDNPNIEITAINVGLSETEPTLRKALAMGADKAIRVDTDPKDAIFTAKQIAEVAKNGNFELIVTGKESIDYNGGQIPGMVAEFLNIPSITDSSKILASGANLILERETDQGKEVVQATLPVVVSAGKGFAIEPKIPNMRGIMQARRKKLTVIPAVEQLRKTKTIKHHLPAPKAACKLVDAQNVGELVRLLHEEAKVI